MKNNIKLIFDVWKTNEKLRYCHIVSAERPQANSTSEIAVLSSISIILCIFINT